MNTRQKVWTLADLLIVLVIWWLVQRWDAYRLSKAPVHFTSALGGKVFFDVWLTNGEWIKVTTKTNWEMGRGEVYESVYKTNRVGRR